MSCMIISARVHAVVAETLAAVLNMGFNAFGFDAPDELHAALEKCRDDWGYYQSESIFKELYNLNNRAYCGRYRMEDLPPVPDMPEVPKLYKPRQGENHHDLILPWHYQLAKLLDCEIYQANESATNKTPLYLALVKFVQVYRGFLVTNNDEYSRAPWADI